MAYLSNIFLSSFNPFCVISPLRKPTLSNHSFTSVSKFFSFNVLSFEIISDDIEPPL